MIAFYARVSKQKSSKLLRKVKFHNTRNKRLYCVAALMLQPALTEHKGENSTRPAQDQPIEREKPVLVRRTESSPPRRSAAFRTTACAADEQTNRCRKTFTTHEPIPNHSITKWIKSVLIVDHSPTPSPSRGGDATSPAVRGVCCELPSPCSMFVKFQFIGGGGGLAWQGGGPPPCPSLLGYAPQNVLDCVGERGEAHDHKQVR